MPLRPPDGRLLPVILAANESMSFSVLMTVVGIRQVYMPVIQPFVGVPMRVFAGSRDRRVIMVVVVSVIVTVGMCMPNRLVLVIMKMGFR